MKEKKEKKKINYLRIIWVTGIYVMLIIILYLVVKYRIRRIVIICLSMKW